MSDTPEEVRSLVFRYADAVNRRDEAQWAACWDDDAEWSLATGRVRGKTSIVDTWRTAMARHRLVVQFVGHGDAWQTPEGWVGRWHFQEYGHHEERGDGLLLAWYADAYGRDASGALVLTRRVLTPAYHGPLDLSGLRMNRVDAS